MAANKAKLSQFKTKTLDEMNGMTEPYIPAVDKDKENYKIPVSNFFDTFKSSGGASNFVVLQDDGAIVPSKDTSTPSTPWSTPYFASYDSEHFSDYSGESNNYVRYSLFQNGEFTTWKKAIDVAPFKPPVYGTDNGLKLNDVNHIIWNTWYGMKFLSSIESNMDPVVADIYTRSGGESVLTYKIYTHYSQNPEPTDIDSQGCLYRHISENDVINGFNKLYLDVHDIVEGLVYEITINIRKIVWASGSITSVFCNTDGTMGFKITFYDELSQVPVYKWAQDNKQLSTYVCPNFLTATTTTNNTSFAAGHNVQFPVLAFAKVYFVKVDGKIYIMGY